MSLNQMVECLTRVSQLNLSTTLRKLQVKSPLFFLLVLYLSQSVRQIIVFGTSTRNLCIKIDQGLQKKPRTCTFCFREIIPIFRSRCRGQIKVPWRFFFWNFTSGFLRISSFSPRTAFTQPTSHISGVTTANVELMDQDYNTPHSIHRETGADLYPRMGINHNSFRQVKQPMYMNKTGKSAKNQ